MYYCNIIIAVLTLGFYFTSTLEFYDFENYDCGNNGNSCQAAAAAVAKKKFRDGMAKKPFYETETRKFLEQAFR